MAVFWEFDDVGSFSEPFLDGNSVDVEGMGRELERAAPKEAVLT